MAVAMLSGLVTLGCGTDSRCSGESCCGAWPLLQQGAQGCEPAAWKLPSASSAITKSGFDARAVVDDAGVLQVAFARSYAFGGTALFAAAEDQGFQPRAVTKLLFGHASTVTLKRNGPTGLSLVWHQSLDGLGKTFYAERNPAGWVIPSLAEALSDTGGQEPALSVGSNGELLVVYSQWLYPGYGAYLLRRPAMAASFDDPTEKAVVLSKKVQFVNDPQVVQNQRGDALVTWYQAIDSSLLVWHSERFGRDGSFSKPEKSETLSPLETSAGTPFAAIAEDGRACLAWRQDTAKPGGPMVMMLALRDASGQWQPRLRLADAFSKSADRIEDIHVSYSSQGDLFVVWQQRHGEQRSVALAHQAPDGRWLRRGDEPFLVSEPGAAAFQVKLAVGKRSLSVAWLQQDSGDRRQAMVRVAALPEQQGQSLRWAPSVRLSTTETETASNVDELLVAAGGQPERIVALWGQGAALHYASLDAQHPNNAAP